LQSKSDDINEEKKDNQDNKNFYDSEKMRSSIGTFIKQMADLNSLVSIGPFTSLMNDPNLNLNALKEYGNLLVRYQSNLNFYISAMTKAYFLAINKIASSATEKMTSEEFRKITINTFEEIYSTMFESSEYSINYNNLLNSIIDLNKSYQRFIDTNPLLFKYSSQTFSKEENDLLFYNLYEIKKLSFEIKRKIDENKNE
jgi:poly[(R)-3-hydroxyalkanoate] polymerase subunit PhaE